MASIAALQKKLKGINATLKLSKAMKTVSAVKFSRLNGIFKNYRCYSEQYAAFFTDENAENKTPAAVVVIASNKGLCGGFNSEVITFANSVLNGFDDGYSIVAVGAKAESGLAELGRIPDKTFIFSAEPAFFDCRELFSYIKGITAAKEKSTVALIYPEYINTLTQKPTVKFINSAKFGWNSDDNLIFVPDKETVLNSIGEKAFDSVIYGTVLEAALGAQAATLMTMRSAFDTATEYSNALSLEIHRRRQAQITSDVIETSSEHTVEN